MVEPEANETALFPMRVGDKLRAARMSANLDLSDIATKTRVPLRHLEGIEAGQYEALPSATYCVGFVKAYARAVGLNESELARDLRTELDIAKPDPTRDFVEYEASDPSRQPGSMLVWVTAALIVLIGVGYAIWRSQMTADPRDSAAVEMSALPSDLPATPGETTTATPAAPANTPPAPASGPVIFTAKAPVWLRIYEGGGGKRLFEKEMKAGESFTVPADAAKPQLLTGRPQALSVTVGGVAVGPLGPPDRTVSDLDISAAALSANKPATAPATTPQP